MPFVEVNSGVDYPAFIFGALNDLVGDGFKFRQLVKLDLVPPRLG